ncbi:hypothetical protein PY093_11990 [Cytobacillus sp. S13-E01]|uniref:hypothetical protein n=1 Tax=Cytobacillus sp. S13-E01 TaxID=3031326 RepID=UPI0023D8A996|nr:hypothetical protein [Cytobacillus sp. S13-E01]MDF0727408.1 hypothetical protein [Cytobacillus sp. S13-E01]
MYESIEDKRNKHRIDLDPELDLRNINFATGENHYLTQSGEDEEDCVSLEGK